MAKQPIKILVNRDVYWRQSAPEGQSVGMLRQHSIAEANAMSREAFVDDHAFRVVHLDPRTLVVIGLSYVCPDGDGRECGHVDCPRCRGGGVDGR